jgi:hypothetical protein
MGLRERNVDRDKCEIRIPTQRQCVNGEAYGDDPKGRPQGPGSQFGTGGLDPCPCIKRVCAVNFEPPTLLNSVYTTLRCSLSQCACSVAA